MKKTIIISIIIILSLSFAFSVYAANAAAEATETNTSALEAASTEPTAPYAAADDLTVEGYFLRDKDDPSKINYYVVVTNNAKKTLNINISAKAVFLESNSEGDTDAASDGTIAEDENLEAAANNNSDTVSRATIRSLGSGETAIAKLSFSDAENCSDIQLTVKSEEPSEYANKKTVLKNINVEIEETDGKFIVTATNKGRHIADYFKVYLLLFDENGNLIDVKEQYLKDDDGELKSGKSITEEIECDTEYASYKVYCSGSASDKADSPFLEIVVGLFSIICLVGGPMSLIVRLYYRKIRKRIENWVSVDAEVLEMNITDKSFTVRASKVYRFYNHMLAKYRMPDGTEHEKVFDVMSTGSKTSPYAGERTVKVLIDPENPSNGVLEKSLERHGIKQQKKGTLGLILRIIATVYAAVIPIVFSLYFESWRGLALYAIYPVALFITWFCGYRNDTEEVRSLFKE